MSATLATEDVLIIETPERVPLHFALASIGNRFLACALDHALQVLTIVIVAIGFTVLANYSSVEEHFSNAPKWVKAVLIVILFLIFSGYFSFARRLPISDSFEKRKVTRKDQEEDYN